MISMGPLRLAWSSAWWREYREGIVPFGWAYWGLPRAADGRLGPLHFHWWAYPR